MHQDDLEALRDLAERYAAGADQGDALLYASAFLPDGQLYVHDPADGPPARQRIGHDELVAVPGLLQRYDTTLHFLGNRRYAVSADGLTATGQVACLAHHVLRDTGTDHVMHIRYDDEYARGPQGTWGIAVRRCRVLFTETRPIDPPKRP